MKHIYYKHYKDSRYLFLLVIFFLSSVVPSGIVTQSKAQGFKLTKAETGNLNNYESTRLAPEMRWVCPEIEEYEKILKSAENSDIKTYANNVMEKFELYTDPENPSKKQLFTYVVMTIENPQFYTENLLNHISTWIKKAYKDWGKSMKVIQTENKIISMASVNIASHSTYLEAYKVYVTPTLMIQLMDDNKLVVSFMADSYKNEVYTGSDRKTCRTYTSKIYEVFPFVPKSSYKNTYAKAYVGTYSYLWGFIYNLRKELNTNFTRDSKKLTELHYQYQKDSLAAMYGEPTKVIADPTATPNINKEIRFYETAQKVIFMGTTIDFKDIISCEIVDDPTFIPGHTTTSGLGFSLFGIGIGGAETTRTADRTIHNYVVNIKIDTMKIPLIRIATGQNENKAEDIASTIEYIFRHRQDAKSSGDQKTNTVTRRTKR